jgi:hypothetical protein
LLITHQPHHLLADLCGDPHLLWPIPYHDLHPSLDGILGDNDLGFLFILFFFFFFAGPDILQHVTISHSQNSSAHTFMTFLSCEAFVSSYYMYHH